MTKIIIGVLLIGSLLNAGQTRATTYKCNAVEIATIGSEKVSTSTGINFSVSWTRNTMTIHSPDKRYHNLKYDSSGESVHGYNYDCYKQDNGNRLCVYAHGRQGIRYVSGNTVFDFSQCKKI
jgi:hypothetical protein